MITKPAWSSEIGARPNLWRHVSMMPGARSKLWRHPRVAWGPDQLLGLAKKNWTWNFDLELELEWANYNWRFAPIFSPKWNTCYKQTTASGGGHFVARWLPLQLSDQAVLGSILDVSLKSQWYHRYLKLKWNNIEYIEERTQHCLVWGYLTAMLRV